MSHTVTAKADITDVGLLQRAAKRIGAEWLGHGVYTLYDKSTHAGVAVRLPKWQYPLIFDVMAGTYKTDNFVSPTAGIELEIDAEGRTLWYRPMTDIDRLIQAYQVEAAIDVANASGWLYTETTDAETGAVVLECLVP